MGQIQSFEELINLIRRRVWLILAVAVIGTLATLAYVLTRPPIFQAAAVIQVQSPTVTDGQEPQSGAAQLLQAIQQRLTTRENLVEVINRHGLFADAPGLSLDKKVDLLRASVSFQSVASAAAQAYGQQNAVSAIIIFATLGSADQAARVANDFAQGILDQSNHGQQSRADQNVQFYQGEEQRVWAEISAMEAKIASYQNAHSETMPAQRDARRDELINLDTNLRILEQQRLALEGQAAEIRAIKNPRETDRRQLETLMAQLTVLESQRAGLAKQRAVVTAAEAATPEVEAVLNGYTRQLQQLQDQYQVITQRMAEAETAQRLSDRQQAERFTLLERALTPEYPLGGGRKKLAMIGAIGSLLAGLALAFVLDLLRPVVRTAAQMDRQLDLRPVVSIPVIKPKKAGRGIMKLLDDPTKPILGLPRYAVLAGAASLLMVIAATAIA